MYSWGGTPAGGTSWNAGGWWPERHLRHRGGRNRRIEVGTHTTVTPELGLPAVAHQQLLEIVRVRLEQQQKLLSAPAEE